MRRALLAPSSRPPRALDGAELLLDGAEEGRAPPRRAELLRGSGPPHGRGPSSSATVPRCTYHISPSSAPLGTPNRCINLICSKFEFVALCIDLGLFCCVLHQIAVKIVAWAHSLEYELIL